MPIKKIKKANKVELRLSSKTTKNKRTNTLTSAIELENARLERKKINAANKARAKQMEREVAKYLRGNRTPGSGAFAAYKSDVQVEFANFPGKYIIECKLTQSKLADGNKTIYVNFKWLYKLQEEVKAMNARFGVLITHFYKTAYHKDFVFIRMEDLRYIMYNLACPYVSDILAVEDAINKQLALYGNELKELPERLVLDVQRKGKGEYRNGFSVSQNVFEKIFNNLHGFVMPYFLLIIPGNISKGDYEPKRYAVFRLRDFKELLAHT